MSPPSGPRLSCPWCDETGVDSGDPCPLCGGGGVIDIAEIARMRALYNAGPTTVDELATTAAKVLGMLETTPSQVEPDVLCRHCQDRAMYWRKGEAPEGELWMEGLCARCAIAKAAHHE